MEVDEQNKYMTLDDEAIKALDIFETKKLVKTGKSLYNILNRCKTNAGKDLLRDWINHPLMNVTDIDKRLNLVEIFFDDNQLRDDVGNCLQRIPDLQKLTRKLTQKKCTLMECCKIYQGFFVLKKLIKVLDSSDNDLIKRNFLNKLKEMDKIFLNYSKLIDGMVDKESLAAGDPIIDANYDDNLSSLYQEMEIAKKEANKIISEVAKKINLEVGKTIKLECSPVLGFQMKMTRKYDSLIRGDKTYIVDGTKKDGIRFTNIKLQDCSASYIEKRSEYDENQSKIIEGMVNELRTYCKPLESLIKILSKLDVIYSLADVAKYGSQSYVRPKILDKDEGKILLKGLRHPCLETLTNIYFIPNSIDFDQNAKKFFIVTGPNMGGKSTFLRSIGLAVLLAQIGSFVPADEAVISIVDCIFTRVGASDKQMKGISTFKAEMLETGQILKKATKNSLVIIDELGRGTSTYDGFGLAWAISKEIASKIQPYCLFATHFHELALLSSEIPSIDNLFVSYLFDEKDCNIKMLYQVKHGVCDQKFGIHVAKMVQFPEEMVTYAQNKVRKYELSENPPNKALLDKVGSLIIKKTEEISLNSLNEEELLDFLIQTAAEVS